MNDVLVTPLGVSEAELVREGKDREVEEEEGKTEEGLLLKVKLIVTPGNEAGALESVNELLLGSSVVDELSHVELGVGITAVDCSEVVVEISDTELVEATPEGKQAAVESVRSWRRERLQVSKKTVLTMDVWKCRSVTVICVGICLIWPAAASTSTSEMA